jgi:hypothetical protein
MLAIAVLPSIAHPQYFGRNKVRWEEFDFRVLRTDHFDVHFYPAESLVTADAARMAERWYARHSRLLGHTFNLKPLIFYADHPDFEQTNVIGGFIDQGTGGVTESGRTRVIMPFTGVYADNDHVLGHEMVHVFQYDIAGGEGGPGFAGLARLPLWLIEGMAEYLSVGRDDPHTAMWLRDAALRNDIPSIRQLTTDPRYFPYRYGQALWAYIGGRWGDEAIPRLYRLSLREGWEPAVRGVLRMSSDTLSRQWLRAIRETYLPVIEGRQRPGSIGTRVLPRTSRREGDMDVSPALSPDGRHVAFFTRRGLFTIDLYVADAQTGRIVKQLTGPNTDQHFDALSFISSSGSWSPDAKKLAFVITTRGDNEIAIFDLDRRGVEREIAVRGVGAISDPAWSPDGRSIVFSGSSGGISDLYLLDLESGRVNRLTNDRHADLQPAWSPDGRRIAWATDRGEGTDFQRLTYAPMRLAVLDVAAGQSRLLPAFPGAKHINPQWAPDGQSIYFIADRAGFSDIYRVSVADTLTAGAVTQVTRLATGVSGITALSPALSVASGTGRLMFSVFENSGYTLYRLEAAEAVGVPMQDEGDVRAVAGLLPPVAPATSRIAASLADPLAGLPEGEAWRVRDYSESLSLEYLGTPGVGVGFGGGGFGGGTALYGGVVGYFGDMLRDKIVGAGIAAQGSFLDTGGELFYLDQSKRWAWALGASHVPYLTGGILLRDTTFQLNNGQTVGGQVLSQIEQRIFLDQVSGTLQYPLSQTRRFEFGLTGTYQWYDFRVQRLGIIGGSAVDLGRQDLEAPDPITYAQASAAYVGDYSFMGFTSPIAGGRYRFEVSPIVGSVNFNTLLADYRRYLFLRPVTLAVRGIHYGRYGNDAEDFDVVSPLFVGQEWFVRGYDPGDFDPRECGEGFSRTRVCPAFDRLIGSRIGVFNAELRIPLMGPEGLGLIRNNFIPIEVSPFFDAGVAWTSDESPELRFDRNSLERVPVFSAGVSLRANLLGFAVIEAFWVNPFQRPGRGSHWGFQFAPGW